MTKGIRIDATHRNGEGHTWNVKSLILGRVYEDGSFGSYIKLYTDRFGIFQMEFLRGSDLAYSFLPKCTEFLEILDRGIVGVSLGMIAEELLNRGYIEK